MLFTPANRTNQAAGPVRGVRSRRMLTRTTARLPLSKLLSTTELSRRAPQKDSLPGQILSPVLPIGAEVLQRKITLKGPPGQGAVYLGCVCGRAGA